MNISKQRILIAAVGIFITGGAWIVYDGRPVRNMQAPTINGVPPVATGSVQGDEDVELDASVAEDDYEKGSGSAVVPQAQVQEKTPLVQATTKDAYTMTDIQKHAVKTDCWAAVNGGVYDLTTWVSRHPGGERPIERLCGTDASAVFNRKHGTGERQKAALALLKIGILK